jgi:hypothetical protein
MPIAFHEGKLVGKDSDGKIWFMKLDGSKDRPTGKTEDEFLADPT